jgi:hypothetical protein
LEDAQYVFEKHHGEVGWCVIAEVEPVIERPRFLAYGSVRSDRVDGKYVGIDRSTRPWRRRSIWPDRLFENLRT